MKLSELISKKEIEKVRAMSIKLTRIMIKEKFNRAMCIGTIKVIDKMLSEQSLVGFSREKYLQKEKKEKVK